MTYIATPLHKTSCPGVHEIYFGRSVLGHHYYIHAWSDLCLGVEKNITISLHYLHGHTLAQEPLPRRGHDINNFGRPILGYHYYIYSLSDLCLGVKKKTFKGILHFHYMT